MIIIDLDLNTFKRIREGNRNGYFYKDLENSIELYTVMNDMLFRYTYEKEFNENDLLFVN